MARSIDLHLPAYHQPRQRRSLFLPFCRFGGVGLFLASAAVCGILFHVLVFGFLNLYYGPGEPPYNRWREPPSTFDLHPDAALLHSPNQPQPSTSALPSSTSTPPSSTTPVPSSTSALPSSTPTPSSDDSDELTIDEIRDMVSSTKGFLARDYSLGLGWNNIRYIIESAAIQSKILNRTLILPSFIYARACEYNITVCAEFAPMVNKGDAIGWDEWRHLPIEDQMAFRIPIDLMMNVTLLRQSQPVITVSDYLRLHNMTSEDEHSNGAWQRERYHSKPTIFDTDGRLPSLYVIRNSWYDPKGTVRVDYLPEEMKERGVWHRDAVGSDESGPTGSWLDQPTHPVSGILHNALKEGEVILSWEDACEALKNGLGTLVWSFDCDEGMESQLSEAGWEVLRTFRGAGGMDYTKTVVEPIRQVVPRSTLRGFKEDYGDVDADVLLIEGEIHLGRKPGGLQFTTTEASQEFARSVLNYLRPPDVVYLLAEALDSRLQELTEGRMWMGSHMRRGDFVRLGWAMSGSPEAHVQRVKEHLADGRQLLASLGELQAYDIPEAHRDTRQNSTKPPAEDDPFYVATDERDPDSLAIIASNGAIFLNDLLTIDDRRIYGWPLMITDVRALVEQALLARSSYFYAHAMSSVAGGIVNMRAARGADPRTVLLD